MQHHKPSQLSGFPSISTQSSCVQSEASVSAECLNTLLYIYHLMIFGDIDKSWINLFGHGSRSGEDKLREITQTEVMNLEKVWNMTAY